MDTSTVGDRPVREIMSAHVLGIVPTAPLDVALRMMVEAGIRHLPVVDRHQCLGMLHESDVLWRLWSVTGTNPPRCGAVMRSPAPHVDTSDTVAVAARRMARADTDAVLVLDDGRVAGIVTATNLVGLLATGVTFPKGP